MRRRNLVLLALALTIVPPARSAGPAEPEWKKASGGLGAVLLVTNDSPGFFAGGDDRPTRSLLSRIKTTSKVQRGETVVAVVIFYGCAADCAGNCHASVDMRLRYPDGSLYGEYEDLELSEGPAPPEGEWEAGAESIGFEVEPDDPLGTYTFEAVVRDRVARRELKLLQTLEVVAGGR